MPRDMVDDMAIQLQMANQLHVFKQPQNHVFRCLFMIIIYYFDMIFSMIVGFKSHNKFVQQTTSMFKFHLNFIFFHN
jgi:hypothetical protein